VPAHLNVAAGRRLRGRAVLGLEALILDAPICLV
jgi:hypothetical protein